MFTLWKYLSYCASFELVLHNILKKCSKIWQKKKSGYNYDVARYLTQY